MAENSPSHPTTRPLASVMPASGTSARTANSVAATISTPAMIEPVLSAACGLPPSRTRTKNVPTIEATMPTPARISGSSVASRAPTVAAAPITIEPMIAPT